MPAESSSPVKEDTLNNLLNTSWLDFNSELMKLEEADVQKLLTKEKKTKNRLAYLMRLYGRFSKLREERERRELLSAFVSTGESQ